MYATDVVQDAQDANGRVRGALRVALDASADLDENLLRAAGIIPSYLGGGGVAAGN